MTLWYRAPELLLSDPKQHCEYTTAVDLWGAGCIFGELWKRKPLLRGSTELEQTRKILELIGTPTEREWPEFKDFYFFTSGVGKFENILPTLSDIFTSAEYQQDTYSLLSKLLTLNPKRRVTAREALRAKYFRMTPAPARIGTKE